VVVARNFFLPLLDNCSTDYHSNYSSCLAQSTYAKATSMTDFASARDIDASSNRATTTEYGKIDFAVAAGYSHVEMPSSSSAASDYSHLPIGGD
jgi:hypothetical protein